MAFKYLKAFNLSWLFRELGIKKHKYCAFSKGAGGALTKEEKEALKAKIDEVSEMAKAEIDGGSVLKIGNWSYVINSGKDRRFSLTIKYKTEVKDHFEFHNLETANETIERHVRENVNY